MIRLFGIRLLGAVALLSVIAAPALAHGRHHRHVHHHYHHAHHAPMFSYLHNYGPGAWPGSYAYYDGPLRVNCRQSAAAYRGQDGRGHPCL
jgi:hypothetical protein